MKIVVLDGYGANPGDLSWEPFRQLGELVVYPRTAPNELIGRAKDAEIVLTNKVVLDAQVLQELKLLKYVGVLATGYNVVDIQAAKRLGIVVTNIPSYSTDSVAQMTFAHKQGGSLCHRKSEWTVEPEPGFLLLGHAFEGTCRQNHRHCRSWAYWEKGGLYCS